MGGYLSNKIGEEIPPDQEAILAQIANLGNPGQILAVNAGGTGVEWIDPPASGSNVVFGEVASGSGTSFTLAHVPIGTIYLSANGPSLLEGTDYTISGANITIIGAGLSFLAGSVLTNYQY